MERLVYHEHLIEHILSFKPLGIINMQCNYNIHQNIGTENVRQAQHAQSQAFSDFGSIKRGIGYVVKPSILKARHE